MSTILKSYDWSYVSKNNKKARTRLYPWEDWFDGRIWKLEPKEDFDGPATSLERVIRTSANRRRLKVRVRIEGNSLIVQKHEDVEPTREVTKSPSLKSIKAAKAAETAFTESAEAPVASSNGAKTNGAVRTIKRRHATV